MIFADPLYFLLLLAVPLLIWSDRSSARAVFLTPISGKRAKFGAIDLLAKIPLVIRILAVTMLVLALARPQLLSGEKLRKTEGL
ncbi:hypothetical protein N9D31_03595, partial [Oligoflexaceae bacterium]|nr:hypothetical protein [Oligoflexaceae bacterium]